MHSYTHSSKITKQKKLKFHAFIYAFLKNNKTKKIKFYAFINALLKKNRKLNFMYSNMHFHLENLQIFMHS